MLDEPLVPMPDIGRVFRTGRRVRLADADATGRLRLDSCARYLQDISNDDTTDAGFDDESTTWVVRRAVIDVYREPRWREWLDLATWCGGLGRRWAERRLTITGEHGGRVEINTVWVHVDLTTMAPARLPERFLDVYGESAGERRVSSKLWLGGPPDDGVATVRRRPWPLRAVDVDLLGHMNNAAYWAAVHELSAAGRHDGHTARRHPLARGGVRAVMEYGPGIAAGTTVELAVVDADDRLSVWFEVDGASHAAACVMPLPG